MAKISLGVDIGSEDIKVVCLEKNEESYKLNSYGHFRFGGDEEALKRFVQEAKLPKGDVRINIEDSSLKIRRLDLPTMTEEEFNEAVRWGMKDIVEGDINDFIFRCSKIDPTDLSLENKIPMLVFAIKADTVSGRRSFAKRIGFKIPSIIEPNAGALACLFDALKGKERDSSKAVVDLGRVFSPFIVIGKKGLVFSRPMNGCSEINFIGQLARDLGIGSKEAEDLKQKFFGGGKISGEIETRLKNSVTQFYSKMAVEIQRSIDGYNLVFGRQKVDEIFLCGNGAYSKGLIGYLNQTLGVKTGILDPFEFADTREFSPGPFDGKRALFAVACGLAVD
ncbi:MAG: pilus assembly protein PilM [Deltaproteobacteria bacterium]|nr:pilus assembly protein PilM [Deltaproteobacteria bacterium]